MWGLIIILALLIPLIAVVLDSHLGRALAARLERDRVGGDGVLDDRVAALEAEVDRLAREVKSLEEQSEFLHRLLERKPTPGDALTSGESHD